MPNPTTAKVTPINPALEGWDKPEPLQAEFEKLPYPSEALPEPIKQAVQEVQGFIQAPVALVASCALSSLSVAIQGHIDMQRANGLKSPVSLYMMTIADSGERKTSVDNLFIKAIREFDQEQAEIAKPLVNEYHTKLAAWEAQRGGILQALKQDASKPTPTRGRDLNDDLIELDQNKPIAPKVPRLMAGDATPEALAYRLAKEWPIAGLISSEAGTVLGSHGMSKDSAMRNLAQLNVLWDGAQLDIERRTSESFTVRGVRLTTALQIQEATLREFLGKNGVLARGSGFLARFLLAWPETTQGTRLYSAPPKAWPSLSAFNRRITEILNDKVNINDNGTLEPRTLEFTPEAQQAWIEFLNEIERELSSGGELHDIRDVASKIADNAARLAALFHVYEYGADSMVSAETFDRASQIATWHLLEAKRFYGELALPEEMANMARLNDWLVGYCKRNRTTNIKRGDIQRLGPFRAKEKLDSVIKDLEELNRVKSVDSGKRRDIYINPKLLEVS
jgi:putative DNA primase/helicase